MFLLLPKDQTFIFYLLLRRLALCRVAALKRSPCTKVCTTKDIKTMAMISVLLMHALCMPNVSSVIVGGSLPEIAQYSPYYLSLNVFTAPKGSNSYILFAITAAGIVTYGGPKKSPRTVIIHSADYNFFRSFGISKGIQSVQNTYV